MADKNAAVASGADLSGDVARRRNLPGATAPGAATTQPQPDEQKIHGAKKSPSVLEILDEWEFLIAPLIFTAFAVFTRLWKIGLSPIVTWDEAQYALPQTPANSHFKANKKLALVNSDRTTLNVNFSSMSILH
ncbi:hypothetical protein ANO14919_051080 [Xylariales sp. No.14919]|nr:hypothetical protein ANO14919_051080 [Xylariales sp. No.14919]